MAVAFKLKRSSISGRAPDTSSIDYGELAINTFDGVLYLKKNDGNGDSVVPLQQVTEYNLAIDNTPLTNSNSNNLSGVLRDLDSAIGSTGGSNVASLYDLTNVDIDTDDLAEGDVLQWDGTKWVAGPATVGGTLDGGDANQEYSEGGALVGSSSDDDHILWNLTLG